MLFSNKRNILIFLILTVVKRDLISIDYNHNLLAGKTNIVPLVVIGGGPAGLSAALYGSRAGIYTVVFQGPKPGGQIIDTRIIENWPGVEKMSGAQAMKLLTDQTKSFGAQLIEQSIKRVDFSKWPFVLVTQDDEIINALSIVIATGALPRKLGVKGEEQYWNKGVLVCALCDAPLSKNQSVVVIGDDDIAIERVLQLTPYAKSITLIVPGDIMYASYYMQEKIAELPNVKVVYHSIVKEIIGDGKKVKAVLLQNLRNEEETRLETSWVYLAIGFNPDTALFKKYLNLTKDKHIKVDCETQRTSIKGIYAAGAVASHTKYSQVGIVVSQGIKSALSALDFLRKLGLDGAIAPMIKDHLYKKKPEKNLDIDLNSDEEFRSKIKGEKVLVYFYSRSCSHCIKMKHKIIKLANDNSNIRVYMLEVDKLKTITKENNIKITPTYIIYSKGKEIKRLKGELSDKKLKNFVEN